MKKNEKTKGIVDLSLLPTHSCTRLAFGSQYVAKLEQLKSLKGLPSKSFRGHLL